MDSFADYSHAIVSVVIYAVIAMVLNAATGIRKGGAGMAPGAPQEPDYSSPAYRLDRTYMNTVEMMGFYIAVVFAAILAGASPFWVNLFASVGLVLRIVANVVYLRGIGAGYGGLRTQLIVGGTLCNLALGALALWAVFV